VMGVLIVIGGIVLLVFLLEYAHRNLNETKRTEPKAHSDEQPNLT
jgi:hypothetical protein